MAWSFEECMNYYNYINPRVGEKIFDVNSVKTVHSLGLSSVTQESIERIYNSCCHSVPRDCSLNLPFTTKKKYGTNRS